MRSPRTDSVQHTAGPPGETFVIWPHRSLRPMDMAALIASVGLGLGYAMLASKGYQYWPVLMAAMSTFLGLSLALRHNNRAALAHEVVEVTPWVVRVSRIGFGSPASPIDFNAFWVRLRISTDRYVEDRITLMEGRRRVSVGNCLSPEERRKLAEALHTSIKKTQTTTNDGQQV